MLHHQFHQFHKKKWTLFHEVLLGMYFLAKSSTIPSWRSSMQYLCISQPCKSMTKSGPIQNYTYCFRRLAEVWFWARLSKSTLCRLERFSYEINRCSCSSALTCHSKMWLELTKPHWEDNERTSKMPSRVCLCVTGREQPDRQKNLIWLCYLQYCFGSIWLDISFHYNNKNTCNGSKDGEK